MRLFFLPATQWAARLQANQHNSCLAISRSLDRGFCNGRDPPVVLRASKLARSGNIPSGPGVYISTVVLIGMNEEATSPVARLRAGGRGP